MIAALGKENFVSKLMSDKVDPSLYKYKGGGKPYTWLGGPMGSKKSIELIAELLRHTLGPKSTASPVIAIKPLLDKTPRFETSSTNKLNNSAEIIWQSDGPLYPLINDKKGFIESRMGVKFPCIMLSDNELLEFLAKPEVLQHIKVFAFDEMQFFKYKKEAVAFLLNNDKIVITAGLDADFRGEPFMGYTDLVSWATDVRKFKATCAKCGSFEAAYSQRLTTENALILVGADDYEARCSNCFVAGGVQNKE